MTGKKDIAQEILAYLRKHPDASDTLDGITEWWLLSQKIHENVMKVKEALSCLVQKGWLVEIKGRDSRIRYRLSHEKKPHRNRFLT